MEPEISIVIPVYKNAATLPELHERLIRVDRRGRDNYEILFVDDACPSGSLHVLRELAGRDPSVAVLSLGKNGGQNRAIMTGLAYARGKTVVVMDADLQDPPEAIPRLLAALEGGAAAVFGGRRGRYESGLRLATSRVFKWGLHWLTGRRIPPDAGLFMVMRREMVERLLRFQVRDPYVIGLMGRTGLRMLSIPVERVPNPYRDSNYTWWMRLRLAWRAVRAIAGPRLGPSSADKRVVDASTNICEFIGARFTAAGKFEGGGNSS